MMRGGLQAAACALFSSSTVSPAVVLSRRSEKRRRAAPERQRTFGLPAEWRIMDGSPADGSLATSPTGRSRRGGILLDEEPVFGLARPASPVVSPREALGSPAVKLGTTPRARGGAFFASDEGEALRLARASYEASEAPGGGGRPARGASERRPERPSRLVRQAGDVGGRRSTVPALEASRRPFVGPGPEGGLGARRASFGGDRRLSF